MKTKQFFAIVLVTILLASCMRAVTPAEAASGKYHHCRPVR